jgi:hypothetical protein
MLVGAVYLQNATSKNSSHERPLGAMNNGFPETES